MSDAITLNIDGHDVSVADGTPLIEAAALAGVHIPHLCYCPGLKSTGACRMCVVELEGSSKLIASCSRQAKDGMVVRTDTQRVMDARRFVADLILSNHPGDCMSCDRNGTCSLQDAAYQLGIEKTSYSLKDPGYPIDDSNPFIVRNYNLCVLCGCCVRVCALQSEGILEFMERGMETKVGTAGDLPLQDSGCDFCGSCVSVCPVAALIEKDRRFRGREWMVEQVESACSLCGCGCDSVVGSIDGAVVRVTSPSPVGYLCARGRFGLDHIDSPDTLRKPLVRRNGDLVECDWEEALDFAASRLREVRDTSGADSVGWIVGSSATNEVAYAFRALASKSFGSSALGGSAATRGSAGLSQLEETFGDLSVVASAQDVETSTIIVVVGADVTADYPAAGAWIARAQARKAQVVVIDSRMTTIAKRAQTHLRPQAGTEGLALARLTKAVLDSGDYDKDFVKGHTAGTTQLEKFLTSGILVDTGEKTGLPDDDVASLAALLTATEGRIVFVVPADIHDSDAISSISNVLLLLGRTQGCILPCTSASNVRGHFELFGDSGFSVADITGSESIRAMVVWDEDSLSDCAQDDSIADWLASLDLLVIAAPLMPELAEHADVVLPASVVSDNSGTRINMEGRRVRQGALHGSGQADYDTLSALAGRLDAPLPWNTAEECGAAIEAILTPASGTETAGRAYTFAVPTGAAVPTEQSTRETKGDD
ncbi:MAG: molybdopterin-dependent oxidoreductase [Actinomycetota bacterium]|nr:molybdopterin-dependent oxidoreductase [Actinomycetota bacterium]